MGTHDDKHATTEDSSSTDTTDSSSKNQHPHTGCNGANQGSQFEDEDGKDDDVFRREDLGPLGVDEVEAE
jgi:hypothetical protein